MKTKRYEDGGDVGYDFETTTDEEGNEVTTARKGYSPRAADTAPRATRTAKAVSKPAARSVSSSKPSTDYVSAARNKYKEAQGYDEASKNKNLSAEDRRAMLGRYAQAMKDYDTLGRASKYAEGKGMKRGGSVKSSASRRADGIASRGKTKGRMI
jgi:hypothetical protein